MRGDRPFQPQRQNHLRLYFTNAARNLCRHIHKIQISQAAIRIIKNRRMRHLQ